MPRCFLVKIHPTVDYSRQKFSNKLSNKIQCFKKRIDEAVVLTSAANESTAETESLFSVAKCNNTENFRGQTKVYPTINTGNFC